MKKDFLLDAIGQIDDDLLLDAELVPPRSRRWPYWGGLAAALAVCVGLWAAAAGGVLPGLWLGSGSSNAPMSPGLAGGAGESGTDGADSVYTTQNGSSGLVPPDSAPDAASGDTAPTETSGGVPGCAPTSPWEETEEEIVTRGNACVFISGRRYIPGVRTDCPSQKGTALGTLTCPAWGAGADGDKEESGAGALLTNAPEYDGLTVWEEAGQYYLELPDGSFLTLVPWEE